MDRVTGTFVDGMAAAGATSGVLTQQQARIFALLYLEGRPLSLDEIAAELEQSKSNISLNIRVLVDWHLVRRKPIVGSRKDHYQAATDFFRAMQEIFERRFRWTVRQVLTVVDETRDLVEDTGKVGRGREVRERVSFVTSRLSVLHTFFSLMDAGIGAFVRGKPFPAEKLRNVVPMATRRGMSS